jgi:hypothetical protein
MKPAYRILEILPVLEIDFQAIIGVFQIGIVMNTSFAGQ